MGAYLIDNPPRQRQYRERGTTPSGVIVVHTAENAPDVYGADGAAEAVAEFIRDRTTFGSYHDLVDSDSTINLVPYSLRAYQDGTGTNSHGYGVSMATQAAKWPSIPAERRERMVKRAAAAAANYARWIKREHGVTIPARRITRAESDARKPGFISHAERDPDRRSDPGRDFPWQMFLDEYARLMAGGDPDTPEDDMTPEQDARLKRIEGMLAPRRQQANVATAPVEGLGAKGKPAKVPLGRRLWILQSELRALRALVAKDTDVDRLAEALAAKLPAGAADKATMKAAFREVLSEAFDEPAA